jgi:hypothetical protein
MAESQQQFSPKKGMTERLSVKSRVHSAVNRVASWRRFVRGKSGQQQNQASAPESPDSLSGLQVPLPPVGDFTPQERVPDEHRTKSKDPLPEFIYRNNKAVSVFTLTEMGEDSDPIEREFVLPSGERLIIDGIPYYDIESGQRERDRTVQVYHNQEGFLMADRVVNGEISRKGSLVVVPGEDGRMEVLGESHILRRGDKVSYNYEKQLLADGSLQLMATTYKFPIGNTRGAYSSVEVVVSTPDDVGDTVKVSFVGGNDGSSFPEPITIKQVADIASSAI